MMLCLALTVLLLAQQARAASIGARRASAEFGVHNNATNDTSDIVYSRSVQCMAAGASCVMPYAELAFLGRGCDTAVSLVDTVMPSGMQPVNAYGGFRVATSGALTLTSPSLAADSGQCVLVSGPDCHACVLRVAGSSVELAAGTTAVTLASPLRVLATLAPTPQEFVVPAMAADACVAPIELVHADGAPALVISDVESHTSVVLRVRAADTAAALAVQLGATAEIASARLAFNATLAGHSPRLLAWATRKLDDPAWTLVATSVLAGVVSARVRIGRDAMYGVIVCADAAACWSPAAPPRSLAENVSPFSTVWFGTLFVLLVCLPVCTCVCCYCLAKTGPIQVTTTVPYNLNPDQHAFYISFREAINRMLSTAHLFCCVVNSVCLYIRTLPCTCVICFRMLVASYYIHAAFDYVVPSAAEDGTEAEPAVGEAPAANETRVG